jgi:hypothetical protein
MAAGLRAAPGDDSVKSALDAIRAVGKEGAGNPRAAAAWKELARRGPDALPDILAGFDGADPTAANWLRLAVDAIAERAVAAGQPLPKDKLEAFVRDTRHAGPGRRVAYEWLARIDPSAPGRLLPGMIRDPSAELRRDAVARGLAEAQERQKKGEKDAAVKAFRTALSGALDRDQVDECAKQLKALGQPVDLAAHFGFVRTWLLLGPFAGGFDTMFPPEQGIDLSAVYPGKAGMIRWQRHVTADPYGVVDLNKAVGKHHGAAAYAFAIVESANERPVEIRAGSNNAIKLYLNGQPIFGREEYHHGMRMDQHAGKGILHAGRNTILVKVCQNEQKEDWAQSWSFQLRVCDAIGSAMTLTVVTPEVPAAAERKVRP